MATRLLGIFLILPVFSVYAERYPGSDLTMAGIAFGIYALAQSILQLPFGWASDKLGRKRDPATIRPLILPVPVQARLPDKGCEDDSKKQHQYPKCKRSRAWGRCLTQPL